uniref:Putative transcription initiation factor iif auxiliary subunit n=1 Tax=Rhipicephalus microplus TaxID=6941 RepID=A0A6G5AAR8_RHIMP
MDTTERPVTLYHILKLFQSETNIMLGKKQLVTEMYDELIFSEPTVMMQQLLTSTRPLTVGPYKHEYDFEEKKEKSLHSILQAKTRFVSKWLTSKSASKWPGRLSTSTSLKLTNWSHKVM